MGEDTGLAYRLGDPVEVRLVEAIPTAGALRFEMLSEGRSIGAATKGRRAVQVTKEGRNATRASRAGKVAAALANAARSSKDRVMQKRHLSVYRYEGRSHGARPDLRTRCCAVPRSNARPAASAPCSSAI